ncbi:MAG: hypothetical protein VKL59_16335 [Nostocaceae cyanobacterium]|nr:hypothetical protein [Nostocaceae cyanobacterium]
MAKEKSAMINNFNLNLKGAALSSADVSKADLAWVLSIGHQAQGKTPFLRTGTIKKPVHISL